MIREERNRSDRSISGCRSSSEQTGPVKILRSSRGFPLQSSFRPFSSISLLFFFFYFSFVFFLFSLIILWHSLVPPCSVVDRANPSFGMFPLVHDFSRDRKRARTLRRTRPGSRRGSENPTAVLDVLYTRVRTSSDVPSTSALILSLSVSRVSRSSARFGMTFSSYTLRRGCAQVSCALHGLAQFNRP